MLVQMNVIVDFKNQHRYDEDEFLDRIQADMRSSLMERVSVLLVSNSAFTLATCAATSLRAAATSGEWN